MPTTSARSALRALFNHRELTSHVSSGGVMPMLAAQGYLPAELDEVLRSSAVAMRDEGTGA